MREVAQVVLEREEAREHDRETLEGLLSLRLRQLLDVPSQALELEARDEHVLDRAVVEIEAGSDRLALRRREVRADLRHERGEVLEPVILSRAGALADVAQLRRMGGRVVRRRVVQDSREPALEDDERRVERGGSVVRAVLAGRIGTSCHAGGGDYPARCSPPVSAPEAFARRCSISRSRSSTSCRDGRGTAASAHSYRSKTPTAPGTTTRYRRSSNEVPQRAQTAIPPACAEPGRLPPRRRSGAGSRSSRRHNHPGRSLERGVAANRDRCFAATIDASAARRLRVLLADDHPLVTAGIASVLV